MLGISPCAHCAVVPSIHNYYIYEQIFKGKSRVHGALGAGPADLYLGLSWVYKYLPEFLTSFIPIPFLQSGLAEDSGDQSLYL